MNALFEPIQDEIDISGEIFHRIHISDDLIKSLNEEDLNENSLQKKNESDEYRGYKFILKTYKFGFSIIEYLFSITIKKMGKCPKCKNNIIKYYNTNYLYLDIKNIEECQNSYLIYYLYELLYYNFNKKSKINEECIECKNNVKSDAIQKIFKLPPYLIIKINRVFIDVNKNAIKGRAFVRFDETLDLSSYCNERRSYPKYKLISVINNIDNNIINGYYIGYFKKNDGWINITDTYYKFNEKDNYNISYSDFEEVKKDAYILIYQKNANDDDYFDYFDKIYFNKNNLDIYNSNNNNSKINNSNNNNLDPFNSFIKSNKNSKSFETDIEVQEIIEKIEKIVNLEKVKVKLPKSQLRVVGLKNLKNTCFINSSIQCLIRITKFRNFFMSINFDEDSIISSQLKNLFLQMWKPKKNILNPIEFYDSFEKNKNLEQYHNSEQNDASDFINDFFKVINEECLYISKQKNFLKIIENKNENQYIFELSQLGISITELLFLNVIQMEFTCKKCKNYHMKFENSFILSLNIENKNNLNIKDLLDNKFIKKKYKEKFYCCNKEQYDYAEMKLIKLPQNLIVKFEKKIKDVNNNWIVVNKIINFEEKLDLKKYYMGNDKNTVYKLCSVINYDSNQKHYYVNIYNNNEWFKISDEEVEYDIKFDEIKNEALILFYEKIEA